MTPASVDWGLSATPRPPATDLHPPLLAHSAQEHSSRLRCGRRSPQNAPVIEMRELAHVTGPLAFDDPWLAAGTSDHTLLLLHMEACMRACRNRAGPPPDSLPGVRRLGPEDVRPCLVLVAGVLAAARGG